MATDHADGEEAVTATLNLPTMKGKQPADVGEGTSTRPNKKKKKDKCQHDDHFVAATERKAAKPKNNP